MRLFKYGAACATAGLILSLLSLDGSAHPGVAGVTWTGSISPLMARHCAVCHDADGGASPPLRTYEEARLASQSIKQAVLDHRMPRWDAVPGFGDFRNEHRLTPYEIDLVAEWADAGAPYGDQGPSPPLHPVHVNHADVVLRVPSKHRIQETKYTFELKTGVDADRWIRGWEFQPGNRQLIESAVIALASGEILGTWVPGDDAAFLPEGVAQRLPANSRILLTVRYRQSEGQAVDSSAVALYFSDRPSQQLKRLALPCGSTRLTESIEALAIRPAIGSSGRSLTVLAKRSERQMEPLGWFRDYSDAHAQTYWFNQRARLPRGTSIRVDGAHGDCAAELEYVSALRSTARVALPGSTGDDAAPASSGFQCPMHPEVRSDTAGTCARCRMTLVPAGGRVEGKYALDAALEPGRSAADQPALRLVVREPGTGAVVRRFEKVHERPFHLFVVSDDLNEFAHIHPESQPDGSLVVAAPRMHSGSYELFADFLPVSGTPQLVRRAIISRPEAARHPELVADAREKTGHRLRVRLELEAGDLLAGKPTLVTLVLTDPVSDAPVNDLEPYLGAWGHMFILSGDFADAVHSHPITPLPSEGGPPEAGSKIIFRQRFPRAGMYRLWAQFQRGGEVETVSFTIAVGG